MAIDIGCAGLDLFARSKLEVIHRVTAEVGEIDDFALAEIKLATRPLAQHANLFWANGNAHRHQE